MGCTDDRKVKAQERLGILKVLIVDDEEMGHVLCKTIEHLGHKGSVAKCYHETLEKIAETQFDLIFLEINISNGSSVSVIREIRQLLGDVNIIVMTSDTNREMEQMIREQRVIYYMIKPIDPHELKSILNHLSMRKVKFLSN